MTPNFKQGDRITVPLDERTADAINRLVERHGYGYTHTGYNKSKAVREIINSHNANSIRTMEKLNDQRQR